MKLTAVHVDSVCLGMKELKVLVDLAMISAAGQGDIEVERVSCLHTAVTGYASLIYDLKKTDGCEEFLAKCKPIWKAVESDPGLPKKLVSFTLMIHNLIENKKLVYVPRS